MTRCVEWYDKFEKDGNFCGLSASGVSQVKAYNEMRERIGKHIPDKALVVDNFPEGVARVLSSVKDDETRTRGLNFVIEALKKREKVTAPALQKTIHDWLKPGSCNVEKKGDNLGHVSNNFPNVKSPSEQKPPLPVEKKPVFTKPKTYAGCYQPGEMPVSDAPVIQPLKIEPDNTPAPKKQEPQIPPPLPPDAPMGEKLKRDEAVLGFARASQLDEARPIKTAGIKVVPVSVSPAQAAEWLTGIVRGYLTPASQRVWESIRKSGELGDTDIEIFQGLIDEAGSRVE